MKRDELIAKLLLLPADDEVKLNVTVNGEPCEADILDLYRETECQRPHIVIDTAVEGTIKVVFDTN